MIELTVFVVLLVFAVLFFSWVLYNTNKDMQERFDHYEKISDNQYALIEQQSKDIEDLKKNKYNISCTPTPEMLSILARSNQNTHEINCLLVRLKDYERDIVKPPIEKQDIYTINRKIENIKERISHIEPLINLIECHKKYNDIDAELEVKDKDADLIKELIKHF